MVTVETAVTLEEGRVNQQRIISIIQDDLKNLTDTSGGESNTDKSAQALLDQVQTLISN